MFLDWRQCQGGEPRSLVVQLRRRAITDRGDIPDIEPRLECLRPVIVPSGFTLNLEPAGSGLSRKSGDVVDPKSEVRFSVWSNEMMRPSVSPSVKNSLAELVPDKTRKQRREIAKFRIMTLRSLLNCNLQIRHRRPNFSQRRLWKIATPNDQFLQLRTRCDELHKRFRTTALFAESHLTEHESLEAVQTEQLLEHRARQLAHPVVADADAEASEMRHLADRRPIGIETVGGLDVESADVGQGRQSREILLAHRAASGEKLKRWMILEHRDAREIDAGFAIGTVPSE